jgi:ornithine cyclodeaminase/alanine dehydrogenase-like protein (mu-crystallin family)
MRILSERDVETLINPAAAIAAAGEAFRLHSRGEAGLPQRLDLRRAEPKGGALVLASFLDAATFGVKTNFHAYDPQPPHARRTASVLVLWDAICAKPRALISAAAFNDHRTAAGFAAAADRLAPSDASTLAVFGAGKIAPATILYLCAIRPIRRVLLVSRSPERAEALAARARSWPALGGVAVDTASAEDAASAADIIAAVTTSDDPVFPGDAVRRGTFVILGGANRPQAREADDALIRRATIVADHLDGALARAGDLVLPLASGVLARERIVGEIGAILDGRLECPGERDVTVFKSIGIATQDLVLATALVEEAQRLGLGQTIDLATGERG